MNKLIGEKLCLFVWKFHFVAGSFLSLCVEEGRKSETHTIHSHGIDREDFLEANTDADTHGCILLCCCKLDFHDYIFASSSCGSTTP